LFILVIAYEILIILSIFLDLTQFHISELDRYFHLLGVRARIARISL